MIYFGISVLVMLMGIGNAAAQLSISLSPTEAFLKGKPGSTVTQEFVVVNDGAVPYFLGCAFNDLWYEGEKTVSGDLGSQTQRQAGYQFQCSPNKILVPPKYVQKINVVGAIPKDQDGERFARFYAQMLPSDDQNAKSGNSAKASIGYSASVGATLGLIAEGTQKMGSEVSDVKIIASKKFQTLQFKIKNTGNTHLEGSGTIVIMDSSEKLQEKVEVKIPFLFPEQTKSVSVYLTDKLTPGSYKALMSVTGATSDNVTFVKEFPISYSK
jgi:hypothetical protein